MIIFHDYNYQIFNIPGILIGQYFSPSHHFLTIDCMECLLIQCLVPVVPLITSTPPPTLVHVPLTTSPTLVHVPLPTPSVQVSGKLNLLTKEKKGGKKGYSIQLLCLCLFINLFDVTIKFRIWSMFIFFIFYY